MHLKSRFNQLPIILLAMVLAVAMLLLAWPRLLASIHFLPVDRAIDRYFETREIPSNRLLTLLGFAKEALELNDHYRYHDGRSLLHYLRGLDVNTPALERRDAYREAEASAVEVVKRAPAQPEAWLRIATVRSILHDEPETVLAPWKMSIFTGRAHSTLLAPRVGIGTLHFEFMDAEARSMLRDQVLLAWRLKPQDLLRELKVRDGDLRRTRALIAETDPGALAEMEARIEKIR